MNAVRSSKCARAGLNVLVLQPIDVQACGLVNLRRAKNAMLAAVLIAACMRRSIDARDRAGSATDGIGQSSDLP